MILFENVTFGYGPKPVLQNASLTIGADERVAILGGSGEGKTTILRLMLGLIRPDAGRILIEGADITDKSEDDLRDIRRKFSIVFQEGALFDSLNVKENVAFCLREFTEMSEDEIDAKVRQLLKVVGVAHAIDLMPDELSGGMHRRVAIARSLAAFEPKMFLYDEATTGLDPINADRICRLINELCKTGTGLIIVTHKVVDAFKVANRFLFLQNGRIIFDGDRLGLLKSENPDIQEFLNEFRFKVD
ncbi:MAG TPA: ATP-binding cassette domain-containing protein [Dissulfurispiraceae bacterium]|nr:ATP-binding cassette domain-containing protein [Dissulfurispiraceae bacterium]